MKKTVSILLCCALMLSFYACSKAKSEPEFTENAGSTTVNAEDVENTNEYSENSQRIVRNISSAADKLRLGDKSSLSDKDIKALEQAVNGTCTKKDDRAGIYHFIVGSTVAFRLDMNNKQITFYVDDELYAQKNLE